jgi:hypothetical protein
LFCCTFELAGQALYHLNHAPNPFLPIGFFQDRVSWTIYPAWFGTTILLIPASWVAGITGVSHLSLSLCLLLWLSVVSLGCGLEVSDEWSGSHAPSLIYPGISALNSAEWSCTALSLS